MPNVSALRAGCWASFTLQCDPPRYLIYFFPFWIILSFSQWLCDSLSCDYSQLSDLGISVGVNKHRIDSDTRANSEYAERFHLCWCELEAIISGLTKAKRKKSKCLQLIDKAWIPPQCTFLCIILMVCSRNPIKWLSSLSWILSKILSREMKHLPPRTAGKTAELRAFQLKTGTWKFP